MGVYFDYFRAMDDDLARATHAWPGGPLSSGPDQRLDGVPTKALFPDPHLEQLLALAAGVPYERGPATSVGLWPPPDTPPPVDDTSPWVTDPSVERLATRVRDALAEIADGRLPTLGAQWADEVPDLTTDIATEWLADLTALARRARDAGEELYCWSTW